MKDDILFCLNIMRCAHLAWSCPQRAGKDEASTQRTMGRSLGVTAGLGQACGVSLLVSLARAQEDIVVLVLQSKSAQGHSW